MPRVTRRERRAKRYSPAKVDELLPPWQPDPDEPWDEQSDVVQPDATTRIVSRYRRQARNGMLIEFAVTLSILDQDGQWCEVLCIDTTNHGSVHRHRDNDHTSPPEVIAEITSPDVIQEHHQAAIDEAYDRYIEERDRHG